MKSNQKKGVAILGSTVVDLTSKCELMPRKGETVLGSFFKMGPGGKGANQAVAAKRTGADVRLLTKIGEDMFGDYLKKSFIQEKLFSDTVIVDSNKQTGTALIMLEDNGSNSILVVPGASAAFTVEEIIENVPKILKDSRVFLTQLEVNMLAIEQGVRMANEQKIHVIVNPAPAINISDALMQLITTITPNETEAELMSGIEVTDVYQCRKASSFFLNKGVQNVIITLGDKGVYACNSQKEKLVDPLKIKAVDTTGAGDGFNGGFAAGLAEGLDFFDAVKLGNIVGGLSTTRFGTTPAMPYRKEIEKYL